MMIIISSKIVDGSIKWLEKSKKEWTQLKPDEEDKIMDLTPLWINKDSHKNKDMQNIFSSVNAENWTFNNASNTSCNITLNPWCEQFGPQQFFEIFYLTSLTILGVFGNLLVIFSILLEKKIHKQANIFIVNLAFADFVVSTLHHIVTDCCGN